MPIKQFGKITLITAGMSLSLLLSGCFGHKNTIKTHDPEVVSHFLVRASQFAEKKVHVFRPPGGYYYGLCMDGKEKKSQCHQLYQAMVTYAKTTTQFKSVTVSDLADKAVYKEIRDTYKRVSFDTVD